MQATAQAITKFECLQLVETVRQAADDDDVEGFVECFAPHGTWARPGAPVMAGRDGSCAFMSGRAADRLARSQVVLCLSPGSRALPAPLTGPARIVAYVDTLERHDEWWQIASREPTLVFVRPAV